MSYFSRHRHSTASSSRRRSTQRRRLAPELLEDRRMLATFTVTSLADSGPGTLREQIANANATPDSDVVVFADGAFSGTITLTSGRITISDSVTIVGPPGIGITISGNNASQIFRITDGNASTFQNVTISDLTIINGNAAPNPSAISGGAISSSETLVVFRSTLSGNTASSAGGAIRQFDGDLHILNSVISNNESQRYAGGAISATGPSLTIRDSIISGNTAATLAGFNSGGGGVFFQPNDLNSSRSLQILDSRLVDNNSPGDGGGLFARYALNATVVDSTFAGNSSTNLNGDGAGAFLRDSQVSINRSTFYANTATDDAGGIYFFDSNASITNSTISSNEANGDGGGIRSFGGSVDINHSTIAFNLADADNGGGDTAGGIDAVGGTDFNISHSIVARNLVAPVGSNDLSGVFSSEFSLFLTTSGATVINPENNDVIGEAPLLGLLRDNGGKTATHAPAEFSPVIDAGAITPPSSTPDIDQRGAIRHFNRLDIGAIETIPTRIEVTTLTDENNGDTTPGDVSLREAVLAAQSHADASTIDFAPLVGSIVLNEKLTIVTDTTIIGPGDGMIALLGSNDRIIHNFANLTLSGLTLSGGSSYTGGAISSFGELVLDDVLITGNSASNGGAIYSYESNTTITNSIISGNTSSGRGGHIFSSYGDLSIVNSTLSTGEAYDGGAIFSTSSSVSISDSTLSGNLALRDGGAVLSYFYGDRSIAFLNSQVLENTAVRNGGGLAARVRTLYAQPSVELLETTLDGNSARNGGGAYVTDASFVSTNSTISNNQAYLGGGLFLRSGFQIDQSTISGNSAKSGGGAFVSVQGSLSYSTFTNNDALIGGGLNAYGTTVDLRHTVIADNSASSFGNDIRSTALINADFSLVEDASGLLIVGSGNLINIDPALGPLTDNGGVTQTHLPQPGSVLIDSGDPTAISGTGSVPSFDQRGASFIRIATDRIDIGAVEYQLLPATCDFDANAACDSSDIDLLVAEIVSGNNNLAFDLTADGLVDLDDRDEWLLLAGTQNLPSGNAYLLGDANLDGFVDGVDFLAWNSAKFSTNILWSSGNFNADSVTDGNDFLIWNGNKFQSADSSTQLPDMRRRELRTRPMLSMDESWLLDEVSMSERLDSAVHHLHRQ